MATKQCIKCGAVLEEREFPIHQDTDGTIRFRNVCLTCYKAERRLRDQRRYARLKAQRTSEPPKPVIIPEGGDPKKFVPDVKDLVSAYLNIIHWRPAGLGTISLAQYNRHFNLEVTEDEFANIRVEADKRLEEFGYYNDLEREYADEANYLVVGDTFGTHTPAEVFDLLRHVAKREGVSRVIVIGHNLDDENIISNKIGDFGGIPVTIIAVKDELRDLHAQRGYGYDIVQNRIRIGDIVIRNQEHITPYVKASIGSLDPMLFGGRMIVNCTRHELVTRPTPDTRVFRNFIASPGSLAEPHVVTIINRLIFANGNRAMLRPTNKDSYHKHRKNETDKRLWERGYILLKHGKVYQRRILTYDDEYRAICQRGVINNKGEDVDTELTLVISDLHAPYSASQTAEAVITDNPKASRIVFNGDIVDCRAFNPHNPYEAATTDLQKELESLDNILNMVVGKAMYKPWMETGKRPRVEFLLGNHEDFVRRFVEKYPQFARCFTKLLWDIYTKYGVICGNDEDWVHIGDTIVYHGSADVFGVSGNNLEQTARSFNAQAIIGHTHSPAIRFGVYRTGCMCALRQGYNNSRLSNWEVGYARVYSDTQNEYVELVNL